MTLAAPALAVATSGPVACSPCSIQSQTGTPMNARSVVEVRIAGPRRPRYSMACWARAAHRHCVSPTCSLTIWIAGRGARHRMRCCARWVMVTVVHGHGVGLWRQPAQVPSARCWWAVRIRVMPPGWAATNSAATWMHERRASSATSPTATLSATFSETSCGALTVTARRAGGSSVLPTICVSSSTWRPGPRWRLRCGAVDPRRTVRAGGRAGWGCMTVGTSIARRGRQLWFRGVGSGRGGVG